MKRKPNPLAIITATTDPATAERVVIALDKQGYVIAPKNSV